MEGGLLQSKSHERKALAMELLRALLLPHLTAAHAPAVLSPRFLRCILDNLRDAKSLLHSEARHLLQVGPRMRRSDETRKRSTLLELLCSPTAAMMRRLLTMGVGMLSYQIFGVVRFTFCHFTPS